ncbi:helix-turn-helix transcriptional regulator [Streptomyces sp. BHT-5-2]|uniref:helix-turn-helix domain-containing protein n=1 Tax=unclassified Streptomyces TaxID=2593676 RepID=UPI001C8D3269|nr:helix-turn-helix transcriptional regulator [Streptomyces sp. BHT-5-2]QZL02355.1 helix-turn-helix transcriptional regulator [Streptomyces sp. BHT-5-2]
MPPRTIPTERQKRLGSELRRLRTAAGMSAEHAAGLLGVDRGKISNMESGVRGISAERLRTLACNCGCTDEKYIEALVAMAQPDGDGWWERYRGSLPQGLLDIAELEDQAVRMRVANTAHIPGLLQTPDHALAVFRVAVPALPEHEVGLRLAHRSERQQVITRDAPASFVAIIHEAALRMQFGGRTVARKQLEHLLAMSERQNILLLVIPFSHGAFPGAGQNAVYVEGPVPQLDTVQVDSTHGPDFLYAEGQLAKYRTQLDWLEELALPPDQSRDFIGEIAHHL